MALEIFDCEQNSDDWHELRRGIVTASQFAIVMMNGRGGKPSVTRRKYLLTLAADRLGGQPADSFSNDHMRRGHLLEDEARRLYTVETDNRTEKVGFVRNGEVGCSPDSFVVDQNGMVELKTKLPCLQLETLLVDEFPEEHKIQCQGQLWVCQREWIDLAVYWPGLPLFVKRAYRDEKTIATIKIAVEDFLGELHAVVEHIRDRYEIAA